ncbi:tRNA epoxyqueuosine(34) reductase QueG [Thalassotalea sp. M1531]|uniref:Epoxyqueuosine reductase n=1 Tax=Thalassotalea algicola TaxID=2716224 RepID=A0A7Y0L9N1_9GAMM|nr:tRNA epoxyqueuosine(34) reductase QueG [Thalassotalea algicola]NMP30508.1 tRNA epoxyqueuosine(34) reductase QueG [Thalassotalea algicola]
MSSTINYQDLAEKIKLWGQELGFAQVGITDIDLSQHEQYLQNWLDNQYHGTMDYMARHGMMRARPNELEPDTVRVISVRLNYLPTDAKFAQTLKNKNKGYVSRYALGRDYHKLMRKRLQQLGQKITEHCQTFKFRPFVDSAPVLERPLAEKAGLGWVGKHSLLINKSAGSWFFLGELLINLPLPIDSQPKNDCGQCVACMKICPTNAIVEPYVVDANRCISYLTIEHKGSIPEQFRDAIGNRIYGCDDCQLICPWNKFGQLTDEQDFTPRNNLDDSDLLELLSWTEQQFLDNTQGSPIRRIGYQSWQRNIVVALGNAPYSEAIINTLSSLRRTCGDIVAEHIDWALEKLNSATKKPINSLANTRLNERLIRSVEKGLPRDA